MLMAYSVCWMNELVVVNLFPIYFPFLIALCKQDYIDGIFLLNSLKYSYLSTHIFADDETESLRSADLQYGPRLQI